MLKQLSQLEIEQLLETIADKYFLQIPQQLADGTRQLAPYAAGKVSFSGPVPQRKPTTFFFPQTERLLTIAPNGKTKTPPAVEKPFALFGLNQADLAGIAFLDRFFLAAPADDVYLRRRKDALLIGLTGKAGPDNHFLPLASGDCDLELVAIDDCWLAIGYSGTGKQLLKYFANADKDHLAELGKMNNDKQNSAELLQQASHLLCQDIVPDDFWEEIADRCILCSGCNLACPTCSCFCVQDRQTAADTERSRVWDSCQLDAFMREASGHNPLGTEALRTRRRIHHKLAADVERWGEFGCVACGRCDRACPTGIGMFAVVEELVKRYGKKPQV